MTGTRPSRAREGGFTITEMMIASFIALIIMAAVVGMFLRQSRMYWTQRQMNDVYENVRAGMDTLVRDVRMAGYGLPVPTSSVSLWIPGLTNRISVTQGASAAAPDRVRLAAALQERVTTTASAVSPGGTTLDLATGGGAYFNTTTRALVFLDRIELLRVVAVSGDRLTVTAHPSLAGRGIRYAHQAGAPVERVEVVTYSVVTNVTGYPGRPYLVRASTTDTATNDLQRMVAVGIESLQATASGSNVFVEVTGRSAGEDPNYRDPRFGDRYRRLTVGSTIQLRNQP